jgi:hypothetical protein
MLKKPSSEFEEESIPVRFTTNVDNDNRYKKGIHHPSAKVQKEVKHKNVIRGIGSESDGEIHDQVINGLLIGIYKKRCTKNS